jgi:hypothetical protein
MWSNKGKHISVEARSHYLVRLTRGVLDRGEYFHIDCDRSMKGNSKVEDRYSLTVPGGTKELGSIHTIYPSSAIYLFITAVSFASRDGFHPVPSVSNYGNGQPRDAVKNLRCK